MADGDTGRVTVADVQDHVAHTLPPATNVTSWSGADGLRLWMLVTFELWRRMAIDGERS